MRPRPRNVPADVDVVMRSSAPAETILQFGTGAFLRAFIGDIVDGANRRGLAVGSIVAVASTASDRADRLNAQGGRFTLWERGVERGAVVDRRRTVAAISRALSADRDWNDVLELARTPALRLVVSNTTEIGIRPGPGDRFGPAAPHSFPGKLTRLLIERGRAFDFDAAFGVTVLPCELIERNGETLRAIVLDHARRWAIESRFVEWLEAGSVFCDTLVDRIVPGAPSTEAADVLAREDGVRDPLATVCEPYRLFAIQGTAALLNRLPFASGDASVVVADDIAPYRLRKLHLLNGIHTVTASAALLAGVETVADGVDHPLIGPLIRRALFDEIVPSLDVDGAEAFAHDVLERLANPFLHHAWADITLEHTAKWRIRVVPTLQAFGARFHRAPDGIAYGFAAYLRRARGDGPPDAAVPAIGRHDSEGSRVVAAWVDVDMRAPDQVAGLVRRVLSDETIWRTDLATIPSFADAVTGHLRSLLDHT